MPKPSRKRPSLAAALKSKRKALGSHGTRVWNANEMKRFGSAEAFYYRVSGKNALRNLQGKEVARRFVNSIAGNVSYWAEKHMLDTREFAEHAKPDEMPAIVFLEHNPKNAEPDTQFFSKYDKPEKRPFDPYSADIEPKQVKGIVRLELPEFKAIAGRLKKEGNLNRKSIVREVTRAMQRKAVAFIRGKKA